jgi:hypothetical protein
MKKKEIYFQLPTKIPLALEEQLGEHFHQSSIKKNQKEVKILSIFLSTKKRLNQN